MASIDQLRASDGSGNASVATVQSTRAALASTIIVDTVLGINATFVGTMGTPHTFTDPVTSETITVISEATAVDFAGHVDGSNLEIDTIAPGYTDNGSAVGDIVIIRPTTQWSDALADVLEVSHDDDGTLKSGAVDDYDVLGTEAKRFTSSEYAPQGYLQNGKIERTVASSNITVAIKTLSGANPSASDPVIVRIGNTSRTITAALSVTKNAGTNWFNSGSAELATNEVDYFTYLGYNATDGVVIGFARIPFARVYGDFSATTTNEKYCAISTITNAASTDEYEVVGRFNATLSATASFNWSVPATSVVISRPIFETRWLTYTPSWTGITVGNGTQASAYVLSGKTTNVRMLLTFGSTTSVSGGTSFSLPISCDSGYSPIHHVGIGRCQDASGADCTAALGLISTTACTVVIANVAAGTYTQEVDISSTVPFTWTTTDAIKGAITYQAA